MSLPTQARFFDASGVSIGSCFINIGWFVQTSGMYRVLAGQICKDPMFSDPNWVEIEAYGYKFSREFFRDCTGHTRETVTKVIEAEMDRQSKAAPEKDGGYGI